MAVLTFFTLAVVVGCESDSVGTQPSAVATSTPMPTMVATLPNSTATSTLASGSPTPSVPPSGIPLATPASAHEIAALGYRVVNSFPHDPDAFTQGLEFVDGVLYEGTGLYGRSSLRKVDLDTGEGLQVHELSDEFFGEGITVLGDLIYQLTWTSQTGFIYDKETFDVVREVSYETEGWGLTNDGERLIMSDGTSTLYFRDPETFTEIKRIEVEDNHGPVHRLNELEYINGEVFANIWQSDTIVRIDPTTGRVTGRLDLTGLLTSEDVGAAEVDVLNGIAYDSENDRIFVTGKFWPRLFQIEIVPDA